ncbi:MAG: phenylacetate--CoA ligase family protein, partial [Alcaligenes sp.]
TTKVRGMFVHPSQVADVARRHPEILRARLVISGTTGSDRMVLKVESRVRGDDLSKRIADSVRDVTKLRADVEWVDADGLPNDGKVIDDVRTYE